MVMDSTRQALPPALTAAEGPALPVRAERPAVGGGAGGSCDGPPIEWAAGVEGQCNTDPTRRSSGTMESSARSTDAVTSSPEAESLPMILCPVHLPSVSAEQIGRVPGRLIVALALAILFALCSPAQSQSGTPAGADAEAGRRIAPLDLGWKFHRGDDYGAIRPDFDDKNWQDVTLPHSFNGADGDDGGGYYRGPAWYRLTLPARKPATDRRVYLQFDGAALTAELWVNGEPIGRHDGGHAAFRFDISDALREGDNAIAVRVDNTWRPTVTPMGGDFTIFGGLYRPVHLIEVSDAHVDLMDYGGPGIRVLAERLDDGSAAVESIARIRNQGKGSRRLDVTTRILDAAGRAVATASERLRLPAGSVAPARSRLAIAEPHLWNGRRAPYLYRVVTEVREGGRKLDSIEVPLGIRTIAFDAKRGFLLNGEPYPLYGVNLFHSGRPGRGLAVTDEEIRQDFALFDEMGATSLRLVHFQHPKAAYDEADRLGFPVWTEIGFNGQLDFGPEFRANAIQQLRELIRQTYNHPSVVMWGLGNEVYSTDPRVTELLEELQAIAREEDPGRPTIYAHCCQEDDHPKARVTDLIGFNRYFGWYTHDEQTLGKWIDRFRSAYPDKPFFIGEYGAGASIRHQEDPPKIHPTDGPFHPEQVQTLYHEQNWREIRQHPGPVGAYVWVGIDLASDGRAEGDRDGINDKGLVTYDRQVRKDAFYWYKANWSQQPVLYVTSRRHVLRTTPGVEVKVYSNRGPVTLTVNGSNLGTREAEGHIARWADVRLRPGVNRIHVTARDGDRLLTDAVEWQFQPPPAVLESAGGSAAEQ